MRKAHFTSPGRPLVFGHRGASAEAPENTLCAFRLAMEQGADGVELDAWCCGTGEVVVIHDLETRRTAGGTLLVPEAPLGALRALDAGCHKGERFTGERIPLLAEVLEALPGALFNVELKGRGGDGRVAAAAAGVIRDARAEERVLVSSFDFRLLAAFRKLAPSLPLGLLYEEGHLLRLRTHFSALWLKAAAVHPEARLCTAARMEAWKARGLLVNVWTVDAPEEARRLAVLGATGLITNLPGQVVQELRGDFGRRGDP